MKSIRTPICFCLTCGHTIDRASNITGKGSPRTGDLSVCINCGALSRFRADMTIEPVADVPADLSVREKRVIDLARSYIRARGRIDKETKQ